MGYSQIIIGKLFFKKTTTATKNNLHLWSFQLPFNQRWLSEFEFYQKEREALNSFDHSERDDCNIWLLRSAV